MFREGRNDHFASGGFLILNSVLCRQSYSKTNTNWMLFFQHWLPAVLNDILCVVTNLITQSYPTYIFLFPHSSQPSFDYTVFERPSIWTVELSTVSSG